jgi:mannose-6-phosphate isomerase
MSIKNFGGNRVKQFQFGSQGKVLLGSGPYEYYIYETSNNEDIRFNNLRSFSCFFLSKPAEAKVTALGMDCKLEQGDCLQAEDVKIDLSVIGGSIKILIAGTVAPSSVKSGLYHTKFKDLYKVDKPWGHELWINGQHDCYALKEIFIKEGTRTSLQYHNFKQETNVLFDGLAKLHFKSDSSITNDAISEIDVNNIQISPISSIDIKPKILHRLEAVTDILLYETSTPHLDDVIRVMDDKGRINGRIEKEHLS